MANPAKQTFTSQIYRQLLFQSIQTSLESNFVLATKQLIQRMAPVTTLSRDVQRSKLTEGIPVLPVVLGEAPKATASADLQRSEAPEGNPELLEISGDSSSHVKVDDPPPVQEDEARLAAAAEQAMQILRSAALPYLPLDRRPGKQIFMGIDLVWQNGEKPFSDVGIILMAAQLIKTWEKVVADDLKAKISKPLSTLELCTEALHCFSRYWTVFRTNN